MPTDDAIDRDARAIIRDALAVYGVTSAYALARRMGLAPQQVQYWYRTNRMTRAARVLVCTLVEKAQRAEKEKQ